MVTWGYGKKCIMELSKMMEPTQMLIVVVVTLEYTFV